MFPGVKAAFWKDHQGDDTVQFETKSHHNVVWLQIGPLLRIKY
jgi:hypothetical protein